MRHQVVSITNHFNPPLPTF